MVIVDDNESVAESLAVAFARIPGIETATRHDPSDALQLFEISREPAIAAIVTDLNLPNLDGLELIRKVREMEQYRTLPAILITADEHLGRGNGDSGNTPNAIFAKPFSVKEVCRVLEELLQ